VRSGHFDCIGTPLAAMVAVVETAWKWEWLQKPGLQAGGEGQSRRCEDGRGGHAYTGTSSVARTRGTPTDAVAATFLERDAPVDG
jgi:hypothetical protein